MVLGMVGPGFGMELGMGLGVGLGMGFGMGLGYVTPTKTFSQKEHGKKRVPARNAPSWST